MSSETDLAWVASVVGDPARSRMLLALMDGCARTAKELAFFGRVAAPTASGHLAKLLECRLVTVAPQGRHRYYRLASPLVGQMIETMSIVAADAPPLPRWRSRVDETLVTARTCYDHIAGRLGVAIADVLQERGHVVFGDGGGEVTDTGRSFLADLGADFDRFGTTRRVFCRPCLDWTERRYHVAGAVGAALCEHCLTRGWLKRTRDSRALTSRWKVRPRLPIFSGSILSRSAGTSIAPRREARPAQFLRTTSMSRSRPLSTLNSRVTT